MKRNIEFSFDLVLLGLLQPHILYIPHVRSTKLHLPILQQLSGYILPVDNLRYLDLIRLENPSSFLWLPIELRPQQLGPGSSVGQFITGS